MPVIQLSNTDDMYLGKFAQVLKGSIFIITGVQIPIF
jgi:hypothetical protein